MLTHSKRYQNYFNKERAKNTRESLSFNYSTDTIFNHQNIKIH